MEMKGRKRLEMDVINHISTCIVRCEKGIYEQNLIISQSEQILKGEN
jgi:hypothetical protein